MTNICIYTNNNITQDCQRCLYLIQGPIYEAVGLREKLGFGSHLILLSSVCVEIQFHTEINRFVCILVLTETHNKASMVTDWQ